MAKPVSKVSSAAQMVLFKFVCVAYHRVHDELPGFCYEPATKRFLCGRTEVIRASTQASADFVKYMTSKMPK